MQITTIKKLNGYINTRKKQTFKQTKDTKVGHLIMMKGLIHQEDMASIYTHLTTVPPNT